LAAKCTFFHPMARISRKSQKENAIIITGLKTMVSTKVATKNVRSVLSLSSEFNLRTVLTQTAKARERKIKRRTSLDMADCFD